MWRHMKRAQHAGHNDPFRVAWFSNWSWFATDKDLEGCKNFEFVMQLQCLMNNTCTTFPSTVLLAGLDSAAFKVLRPSSFRGEYSLASGSMTIFPVCSIRLVRTSQNMCSPCFLLAYKIIIQIRIYLISNLIFYITWYVIHIYNFIMLWWRNDITKWLYVTLSITKDLGQL